MADGRPDRVSRTILLLLAATLLLCLSPCGTARAQCTITQHPTSRTVCPGTWVNFRVTVSGATAYQWRLDGEAISDASGYIGTNTTSLIIPAAQEWQAGSYDCLITTTCGPLTSNAATLTVSTGPTFTGHPLAGTFTRGATEKFTVQAWSPTSAPITFQWRKDGQLLADVQTPHGSIISGSATTTLTVSGLTSEDQGAYDVVATDACGSTISQPAAVSTTCGPRWFRGDQPRRKMHAVAYDSIRDRVVLFGGIEAGGGVTGDTWEWDGARWSQRAIAGPPARTGHAMAFDRARGRTVLFGGSTEDPRTWEWDGLKWTAVASSGPVPAPCVMAYDSLRGVTVLRNGTTWLWDGAAWVQGPTQGPGDSSRAMAFDEARGQVVFFGGQGSGGPAAETWVWDGTAWTRVGTSGPSPRYRHAMAYDPLRSRVVLYGGSGATGGSAGDTWEWNGSSWSQRITAGPGGRQDHAMVFDISRGAVMLTGGAASQSDTARESWAWDGAVWSSLEGEVPSRIDHAMVYDSARDRMVSVGGRISSTASPVSSTWESDGGGSWVWRTDSGVLACHSAAMAYDSARGRAVLFGGIGGPWTDPLYYNQTREWTGSQWVQRNVPGPSARGGHAMAYDSARARAVLFGGSAGNGPLGDTWEWDGAAWSQAATTGPGGRFGGVMAYDSVRGRTVLFGGSFFRDTWEWDGAAWVQVSTDGPPSMSSPAMAFDSARGRTVLHGTDMTSSQTWEWDGTTWALAATMGPPPRNGQAMAFDSLRGRVVLYGSGEVWAWDGTAWTQIGGISRPPELGTTPIAFDAARGRAVMSVGSITWEWDGSRWSSVYAPEGFNSGGRMISDADRGVCTMFATTGQVLGVWDWNGAGWTDRTVAAGPSRRAAPSVVYDLVRDRTVLYGGNYNGALLDTWEWDGTGWTEFPGAGSPVSGEHLYGLNAASGRPALINNAGAWEWTGAVWEPQPYGRPPGRRGTLIHDSQRGRTVLVGNLPSVDRAETWEFDGQAWVLRSTGTLVPRTGSMTYDSLRGRIVHFGGDDSTGTRAETWEWGDPVAAVTAHPRDTGAAIGETARFLVAVDGVDLSMRWRRDGVPLTDGATPAGSIVSGATTLVLTITGVRAEDEGHYDAVVSTGCSGVTTSVATLSIAGACPADWDADGEVTSGDISAFLTAWLGSLEGGTLDADFNADATVNSSDIAVFLTAWLSAVGGGC